MSQWKAGLFLAALAIAPVAQGQDLSYVGSALWAENYDVQVVGNYAYCAYANGLMILDISDQSSPVLVGQAYCQGKGKRIAVANGCAFLADSLAGLQIIDLSDIHNPWVLTYPFPSGSVNDIYIVGNYAFIAHDSLGLQILDITFPYYPAFVGGCRLPNGPGASAIYADSQYAYIGTSIRRASRGSFYIFDISDLTNPIPLGSVEHLAGVAALQAVGNYMYVAMENHFNIYDISNPEIPLLLGRGNCIDELADLAIEANYAYTVDSYGFYIFNITDPTNPMRQHSYIDNAEDNGIFLSGNSALIAYKGGLKIMDISDPNYAFMLGNYDSNHDVRDVEVQGNYAYVADGEAHMLRIVDISDQYSPQALGSCRLPDIARGVAVSGDYAFVADNTIFEIVNISDPDAPHIVGNCESVNPTSVFIGGNCAYLGVVFGMAIVDIEDPANPVLTGSYNIGGSSLVTDVYVRGSYAYIAIDFSPDCFQILNIEDPSNPILVGGLSSHGDPSGIVVSGEYAYLAAGDLLSIDISNPASPVIAAQLLDSYSDVFITGNYAYTTSYYFGNGLQSVDISSPQNPLITENYFIPGNGYNIFGAGDYLYIANQYSMLIFESNPTGVNDSNLFPSAFFLYQNYPNPFNAQTTIRYNLRRSGPVTLSIYNLIGQRMATIVDGMQEAGEHKAVWNADNVPSGVYFTRLGAEEQNQIIRMLLLK